MAGLENAKYMLITLVVILAVSNIFAINLDDDSFRTGYIDQIYDNNTGRFVGNGTYLNSWSGNIEETADTGLFDFVFKSWSLVKNAFNVLFNFAFVPYTLVDQWVKMDNLESLNWLPPLVGLIWSLGWVITFLQIIWKE